MLSPYAELHCLSNFTFLRGASHAEELIERAKELGYEALAITDECSLAGVVRAHIEAKQHGFKLIIGSEFSLQDIFSGSAAKLILLAQNRNGYGNLSELITTCRRRASKGFYQLLPDDLRAGVPDCLALWVPDINESDAQWQHQICTLQQGFPELWAVCEMLRRGYDQELLQRLKTLLDHSEPSPASLKLLAAGHVHFHIRSRKTLHDCMTAIRLNTAVAHAGKALLSNAEQHLRSRLRLAQLYPKELLEESALVASRCQFSLDELRYEYPEEIVPAGETPSSWLRTLTYRGAPSRYPQGLPESVKKQIEHELKLIADLKYEPYFLTVADIVHFARSQNILCQGRGSAANSAVCYCLGITEVDPARMSVLFERFISKERNEPPDIDVDFEHQRREEVMQYIYRKYGRDRAALTATVVSYRARSAVRDIGKALNVDAQRIDNLAKSHQWWDSTIDPEQLREAGFDMNAPLVEHWIHLTRTLKDFPRHLSQHTGGFVIARDKLSRLVPIENAAMVDRSVIQWDKDDLDALGLLKVDILALGMLSAIRRALDIVGLKRGLRDAHGQPRGMLVQEIPAEDPQTYQMICDADTVGVFQIESRAQMSMLPRLRPREFYDLVIEVAIVRPGPIQGGMVHPFLRRRQGLEPVDYPREEIKPALARTLGIPIFQEQVMQIAILAAGFSPGEADQLRRAMAAWKRKGGLHHFYQRVIDGMLERGYTKEFAERIFKQMEGFGEYGFPESHAASFALLVYISCWIKCHEPAAFLAALLNSQPMGFYAPAQLVRDARTHGVEVRGVDVLKSRSEAFLELTREALHRASHAPGAQAYTADHETREAVRLGFNSVRGLSREAAERIVIQRTTRQQSAARAALEHSNTIIEYPFENVEDLARSCALNQHDLRALAQANALESLAGHRRQAAWEVAAIQSLPGVLKEARFNEDPLWMPSPTEAEQTVADYRALGIPMGRHPLDLLRADLHAFRVQPAEVLKTYPDGRLARASGIVTHRQRPETAKGTIFVTLEDETGAVNVIVWPDVFERYRKEVLGAHLMTVYGTWQRDAITGGQVTNLLAQRIVDHSDLLGRLSTHSRNFR
jgi:DNA-directed DNA polymerase III PolC